MATQTQLHAVFGALADPTRLAVVERLLQQGAAPVSTLSAPFGMAGPSFLKHLGVLERAGLLATRKEGRVRMVALAPGALDVLQDWVDRHRRLWEDRLDRLGETLDEDPT
jgi:DNA-binding transcriptional ArsR family regulator